MPSLLSRFQSGWNAFMGRDPTKIGGYPAPISYESLGVGSSVRPDRTRYFGTIAGDRSILGGVICKIAVDAAQVDIKHVRLENDRYVDTIDSSLNRCLTREANIDQTGRAFIQDAIQSMCDEGHVAIVPTHTRSNPFNDTLKIDELRVGKVTQWYPKHVRVLIYNEETGKREEVVLPKALVAIVQNPLYEVMNEPNSTLQRLKRTLSNMDVLDAKNASGKLDLIIQLPYVVRTDVKRKQAADRRKEIEMQLTGSKYGIAYTDATERITQLNRPVENNYWNQAKELTSMLYNQLGLTQGVFDGTADEKAMNNYYSRTIEPILSALVEEMERKFLTPTAITQGQAIRFFRNQFKLVTAEKMAEIADKFTRNEIATSNEIRMIIGWKPSQDPKADELRNSNIAQPGMEAESYDPSMEGEYTEEGYPEEELSPDEIGTEEDQIYDEELDDLEEDVPLMQRKFSSIS